LKKAIKRRSI